MSRVFGLLMAAAALGGPLLVLLSTKLTSSEHAI